MSKKKKNTHKSIQKKLQKKQKRLKKKSAVTVKNRRKSYSMSRLKDNLRYIPWIAFEPEIQEITPAKTPDEVLVSAEEAVDRVNLFYDDFMHNAILEALDKIEERYKSENNKMGLFNISTMKYLMNEKKYPGALNHLVVAKYYHYTQNDSSLTKEDLAAYVEGYEKDNAEILENIQPAEDLDAGFVASDVNEEELSNQYEEELPEAVLMFGKFLSEKISDAKIIEEYGENFEVFYNDFLVEEKNVNDLKDVKTNHLTLFYDYYFVESMNPTEADKKSMAQTLSHFADMLLENGIFTADNTQAVKSKLL